MEILKFKLIASIIHILDKILRKDKNIWVFSTHHLRSTKFIENQRAVFECIKNKENIKKIIIYRENDKEILIDRAANYELVKHGSYKSYYYLIKSGVLFLTHSISMDYSIRYGERGFVVLKLNLKNRVVVNLWHGIAIKRLLNATNSETQARTDRENFRKVEREFYKGLISSSEVDGLIMAAMFYPLEYSQIWTTGLPRNDFLKLENHLLPNYIQESIQLINKIKGNKKLIIYAPTYRQVHVTEEAYYHQFTDSEINFLKDILKKNNAIFGYRPHYFKNTKEYFNFDEYIDNELIFDFSNDVIPEYSAIARECDILITDYSSVALETLYLDKPIISFAYDIKNYKSEQDGLIYELDMIFSKNVFQDFKQVIKRIDNFLTNEDNIDVTTRDLVKKLFFKYNDCNNSKRVVDKVFRELNNIFR